MKWKDKLYYRFELYKQSVTTQTFTFLICLSVFYSFYGLVLGCGYIYTSAFMRILSTKFYIIGILLIMLFNTMNIYRLFELNSSYIIRFASKKEYLKELIKNICFGNFITFSLNMILLAIGFMVIGQTGIHQTYTYTLPEWIYLFYDISKFLIIIELISITNILLLKVWNKELVIISNILLYALIYYYSYSAGVVENLPLFVGNYFMLLNYKSFSSELLYFSCYMGTWYLGIIALKKWVPKKIKTVIQ